MQITREATPRVSPGCSGPGHRSNQRWPPPAAGPGKQHAVLAHLITEPELSTAGPLDATLAAELDDDYLAALAYEAEDRLWIPSRRRRCVCAALPLA